MSMPALLDDTLYDRAAKFEKEIEDEALAKAQAKEKTGKKKKADVSVKGCFCLLVLLDEFITVIGRCT